MPTNNLPRGPLWRPGATISLLQAGADACCFQQLSAHVANDYKMQQKSELTGVRRGQPVPQLKNPSSRIDEPESLAAHGDRVGISRELVETGQCRSHIVRHSTAYYAAGITPSAAVDGTRKPSPDFDSSHSVRSRGHTRVPFTRDGHGQLQQDLPTA